MLCISEKALFLISVAALFVKVRVRMEEGTIPFSIMKASLEVIVFVFPLPAPANISKEPSIVVAASLCESFKLFRTLSIRFVTFYFILA